MRTLLLQSFRWIWKEQSRGKHVEKKEDIALLVDDVSVNYQRDNVLWNINFSLPKASMTALIGPNGAGKTSLMHAIMGIVKPLCGTISIFGKPLSQNKKNIAFVPQKEAVDWNFPISVLDVVLMGRYHFLGFIKWFSKKDKKEALELLEQLDMLKHAYKPIAELSGGQQKRVFIARALLQKADIMLFDEPFAGIDQTTEMALLEWMQTLKKQGMTLLVVHHDILSVKNYFPRTLLLNRVLIGSGPTSKVLTAENLEKAYGAKGHLLEEVIALSSKKMQGF
ncbi:manganese ABC transporter ATP-binding protein [Candidatus Aerophobetes bacterium]|uniref:Manganese ABC transporter ATP-binding protein n=1 Tax=Aerophobetes bacterium TaxID=2030807 RepID=A0A2A4X0C7_UNCAE|nr:MAG: manganese ABC transporter ATP-binding protein [Candidatus Aerophobetes bacterium]